MKYSKEFSEKSLFNKIMKTAKKAGISVIYAVLLLFYTLQKPSIPKKAKATIMGALGYFISPIDAVIDVTPMIGYTDDVGIIVAAIIAVAMYIDDEIKQKARKKLKEWFDNYNESLLEDIDDKVNTNK